MFALLLELRFKTFAFSGCISRNQEKAALI